MQHVSNLVFPRGVRLVKTYYSTKHGEQEWCYFPTPSQFVRCYEDGESVQLGMRTLEGKMKGRMNIATFSKAQVEGQGDWDNDRMPNRKEADDILIAIGRKALRKGPKEHTKISKDSPIHLSNEAIKKTYDGSRYELCWFGSMADNVERLALGEPLKVAVLLANGAVDIYDIIDGQMHRRRKPSPDEKGSVYRMLNYKPRKSY